MLHNAIWYFYCCIAQRARHNITTEMKEQTCRALIVLSFINTFLYLLVTKTSHFWGRCIMALSNIHSEWTSNPSCGLGITCMAVNFFPIPTIKFTSWGKRFLTSKTLQFYGIKVHSTMLTLSQWVTQLLTHHRSISTSPGVITHSTPQVVYADLHSAFIGNVTSCQSYLTVCTWSCK